MEPLPETGLTSDQLFQLHMARLQNEKELAKIAADKEVALAKIKSDERLKMSQGNFLSTCLTY